jgi:DNA-binding NarL/FixJ family response regulator
MGYIRHHAIVVTGPLELQGQAKLPAPDQRGRAEAQLPQAAMSDDQLEGLTRQILQMTADGCEIACIAEATQITIPMVKKRRREIMDILGADNMHQAIAMGLRRNLIR